MKLTFVDTLSINKMEWRDKDFTFWVENGCNKKECSKVSKLFLFTITELPKEITLMTQLKVLYLSGNKMDKLTLSNLDNLEVLHLHSNNIKEITLSLNNLQSLHLSNNKIGKVKETLSLPKLKILELFDNQMEKLFTDDFIENLRVFNCYNNNNKIKSKVEK